MDDPESREINPDLMRAHYARLMDERDQLGALVGRLQVALRDAIRDTTRVRDRIIKEDDTREVDWTDDVRAWARLCHLDLAGMEPAAYAKY